MPRNERTPLSIYAPSLSKRGQCRHTIRLHGVEYRCGRHACTESHVHDAGTHAADGFLVRW